MVHVGLWISFLMKRHLCSAYLCFKGIVLGIFPWYKSGSIKFVTREYRNFWWILLLLVDTRREGKKGQESLALGSARSLRSCRITCVVGLQETRLVLKVFSFYLSFFLFLSLQPGNSVAVFNSTLFNHIFSQWSMFDFPLSLSLTLYPSVTSMLSDKVSLCLWLQPPWLYQDCWYCLHLQSWKWS